MPVRKKLDISMNILVTTPVKMALQRVADENMISISDIVRAAINVAVPMQFEKYPVYLAEEQEKHERNRPRVLTEEEIIQRLKSKKENK